MRRMIFGIVLGMAMVAVAVRFVWKDLKETNQAKAAARRRWQELGFQLVEQPLDEQSRANAHIPRWGIVTDTFAGIVDGEEAQVFSVWRQKTERSGQGFANNVVAFRLKTRLPVFLLMTRTGIDLDIFSKK